VSAPVEPEQETCRKACKPTDFVFAQTMTTTACGATVRLERTKGAAACWAGPPLASRTTNAGGG
jgi:hypothetical protein